MDLWTHTRTDLSMHQASCMSWPPSRAGSQHPYSTSFALPLQSCCRATAELLRSCCGAAAWTGCRPGRPCPILYCFFDVWPFDRWMQRLASMVDLLMIKWPFDAWRLIDRCVGLSQLDLSTLGLSSLLSLFHHSLTFHHRLTFHPLAFHHCSTFFITARPFSSLLDHSSQLDLSMLGISMLGFSMPGFSIPGLSVLG
ncbi:hypothetical protein AOQ84DRAFT_95282 [Glonium stellatum]|uniref:Uncharacterized protein n=1 Tax=Glonium stellatum TaxID=574774 RepID=A0A8E2EWC6_9PEZI|nr:hypothetical protein AOQ84DRAFT_95282 [Glonium stellatum]